MNVKISIFDVIAYILPGTVILLCLVILMGTEIKTVEELIDKSVDLNISLSVLFGAVSYIFGFAIYEISGKIFQLFNWIIPGSIPDPKPDTDPNDETDPKKEENIKARNWVLLREFSEANYNLINRWVALKGMAQNLIGTLLILALVCTYKYFIYIDRDLSWLYISVIAFILCIVLTFQTRKYKYYTALDLNKTIEVLDLEKKARNNSK